MYVFVLFGAIFAAFDFVFVKPRDTQKWAKCVQQLSVPAVIRTFNFVYSVAFSTCKFLSFLPLIIVILLKYLVFWRWTTLSSHCIGPDAAAL